MLKLNQYSDFWINNTSSAVDDLLGLNEEIKKGRDLVALTSYRRAIANFVSIITNENIPVRFKDGQSFTDGKSVTVGANLNDKNFDVAVGLALHEGSHIKLSDFGFLGMMTDYIEKPIYKLADEKGFSSWEAELHIKSLLNYIEDRRIDYYVFSTSPGYKGYYHSMYDKYFNNKVIDKALQSSEYTDEVWKSYEFRLINLHNKNRNLNALNGLKEIWNLIDLKNISRLSNTTQVFNVAIEVYKVILNNLGDAVEEVDKDTGEINTRPAGTNENADDNGTTVDTGDAKMKPAGDEIKPGNGSDLEELSPRQKSLLEKAVQKQEDFIKGNIKKAKLSKKDSKTMNTLETAGARYEEINLENKWGYKSSVKTLVIRELTKDLIDSDEFRVANDWNEKSYDRSYNGYDYVEEGIRLGTMLGRKLKIRGEEKTIKYNRKSTGKIDRRIIAELGFNNENVFSQVFVERYNKADVHISIDASGSMNGYCWNKAMTAAIAIIKAAEMAGNIHVVVTIRSTHDNAKTPLIMVVYDSKKDKLTKVKSLFKYLSPAGTTPEGLTFEAISKELIPGGRDNDSYFINFSDGMPMFYNDEINYNGDTAINHTRKSIENIRRDGIKVLSYFIGESYTRTHHADDFKKMYGVVARFINPTNMMEVARTMNNKFLER